MLITYECSAHATLEIPCSRREVGEVRQKADRTGTAQYEGPRDFPCLPISLYPAIMLSQLMTPEPRKVSSPRCVRYEVLRYGNVCIWERLGQPVVRLRCITRQPGAASCNDELNLHRKVTNLQLRSFLAILCSMTARSRSSQNSRWRSRLSLLLNASWAGTALLACLEATRGQLKRALFH